MSDQACDGCADPKHFSAAHSESYLSPSPGPPSASKLAPLQLTPCPSLHLLHLPPLPSSSSSRSYSSSPVAVHLERALRAFGATIPTHRGQPEATTARLRRLTGAVSSGPYCRQAQLCLRMTTNSTLLILLLLFIVPPSLPSSSSIRPHYPRPTKANLPPLTKLHNTAVHVYKTTTSC